MTRLAHLAFGWAALTAAALAQDPQSLPRFDPEPLLDLSDVLPEPPWEEAVATRLAMASDSRLLAHMPAAVRTLDKHRTETEAVSLRGVNAILTGRSARTVVRLLEFPDAETARRHANSSLARPLAYEIRGNWVATILGDAVRDPEATLALFRNAWGALDEPDLPPVDTRYARLSERSYVFDSTQPAYEVLLGREKRDIPGWQNNEARRDPNLSVGRTGGVVRIRRVGHRGSERRGDAPTREEVFAYGDAFALVTAPLGGEPREGLTTILGGAGRPR